MTQQIRCVCHYETLDLYHIALQMFLIHYLETQVGIHLACQSVPFNACMCTVYIYIYIYINQYHCLFVCLCNVCIQMNKSASEYMFVYVCMYHLLICK